MKFLEKDLEQIIFEANPEQLRCINFGGIKKRQLNIPGYGISDLVVIKRVYQQHADFHKEVITNENVGLEITVCELKKDKIGISAFLQAVRYCKGISNYLKYRNIENFYFKILLIGKDIDTSGSFIYLTDLINIETSWVDSFQFDGGIKIIDFCTYKYDFDGIKFKYTNIDVENGKS